MYQSALFGAKSHEFSKIFLNLSQFWLKFRKNLKNRPIHITNFAFNQQSFILPSGWFCYPSCVLKPLPICNLHVQFFSLKNGWFYVLLLLLLLFFVLFLFCFVFQNFCKSTGPISKGFSTTKMADFTIFRNFCDMGPSSKDFLTKMGPISPYEYMWLLPGAAHPHRAFCSEYPPRLRPEIKSQLYTICFHFFFN